MMLKLNKYSKLFLGVFFLLLSLKSFAASPMSALTITDDLGNKNTYSLSLQILAFMTAISLIPGVLLSMTSFTRVIIVLGILRQAIGMPQTPNNQILIGISLFLTFFIMAPVFKEVNSASIEPFINEEISMTQALTAAQMPVKAFMINQTRENDLIVFKDIAKDESVQGKDADLANELSFSVLLPAFITSELKTSFQIGFMLFIPFLVIDLVVASVLMAMGMMMLSPLIISLPFKIMLFILVDGWTLVVSTLALSFGE